MEVCPPEVPIIKMFIEKGYLQSGACSSGAIPFLKPLVAVSGDCCSHNGKRYQC